MRKIMNDIDLDFDFMPIGLAIKKACEAKGITREQLDYAPRHDSLKAGIKLPSQRELADFLDVNLSTISKAYKLCEQKGLLSASVGNVTYVSSDAAVEPVLLRETETRIIDMGALVPFVTNNYKVKQHI